MKLNQAEVLSVEEIKKIDETTKEILEEVGVKVCSIDVLKIYEKAGCKVNYEKEIVKIPSKITERCLESAPSEFKLYNREADDFLEFGKNLGYCASGHNAIFIFDDAKMDRRPISKEEVGTFAKISDYLPNVHIVGIQAMPQDVQPKASILHALDAALNNTTKHIYFSPENVVETKALLEMLRTVSAEKELLKYPIATCQLSPISTLTWSGGTAEAIVEVANSGVPICFLPMPYCGVSGPITLAGALTVHNIEAISAIVLAQIVNEGCPVIYGAAWTNFDMGTGAVLIATPESCLLSIAQAQMTKYYGIPSHCTAFETDSNIYDEQNGFEKIFNTIATLQSGINLIVNAGMFSSGMTVSYEQLIVDHEMVSFVYRYLKGIEVNNETIAKDIIKKVGHGKDFLGEEHTIKYLRSGEHVSYKVSNRNVYDNWKKSGKPTINDNAKKIANEIITEHKPKLLPRTKQEKLKEIISKFEINNK